MNMIDFLNIASGSVSVVLAVLAIILAIYFFVQSKNTEKNTAEMLAGIRVQTDIMHLNRINKSYLEASFYYQYYLITNQHRYLVKDSTEAYAIRERQPI